MVVKVYVSGISGNKEVKKRQQRVLMILDSKNIKYDVIDITEPGKETDKDFMQNYATSNGGTVSDPNPRSPLPPQLFNDDEYCGDYDQFDLANEVDTLEQFLKLEVPPEEPPQAENGNDNAINGNVVKETKESSQEKEVTDTETVQNESAVEKEKSPSKEGTPAREATPAKEDEKKSKENTPDKETTPAKESTPEKDLTPKKESTPEKESIPKKEPTPERSEKNSVEKDIPAEKEPSPAKEVEEKHTSKEATPEAEAVNENGTASSRDHSVEKETEAIERKNDPSELLIESEQSVE